MEQIKSMFKKKHSFSTVSIIVVFLVALFIDIDLKLWKEQDRVIEHDVHGYYTYLPAIFIYDDIKLEKSDYRLGENYYMFWISHVTDDGVKMVKATSGMSMLYAPFFFVAHGIAKISDYPADGFSDPYKLFLLFSALFYLFLGLNYTKKILLEYNFSDKHIGVTILIIGVGTNFLAYASQSATMPHVYNYALFSMFIFYTIQWYKNYKLKDIFILGLLLGIISLVRPTNILIALFFILYNINSIHDVKERILLFKKEFVRLNLFFPLILIVWIPQFVYWKITSGSFIFYSYTEEGFYWLDPKIIEGLFSFRKGWLVYTPVMIFSIIGIFLMKKEVKKLKFVITAFSVINIYIIFSWWCWWYGGTFGQRSMIDSYSMLAIPLASFVQFVDSKKKANYIFYPLVGFFIWLNIFQTYQFQNQCLHYDSMSMKLYFKQFGIMHRKVDYEKYVDWADYNAAKYRGGKKKQEKQEIVNIANLKKVNIIASNGKYLCTEWNRVVIANKDRPSTWEEYYILPLKDDKIAILSYDNLYLSSDLGLKGETTATKKEVKAWETYEVITLDDGYSAFKTTKGSFLSVDPETFEIHFKEGKIGETERFKIKQIN
tara:strand:- start:2580 stop:4382 length:1803 start_codon:yes stop_codon:yes gene_type:complete